MELRSLEYFLAVAREQSITAASEVLHISQPALSMQLKALEDELGKKLLIRGVKGSRRVLLTDEGTILRNRAEEILSLVQRMEEEIESSDENVAGTVFIGAGETRLVSLFAETAREIQAGYPDIRYGISSGNAGQVLEFLDKGLIDFGLLTTEIDASKYDSIPVPLHDVWGVLMPRDSELAAKDSIVPEDLWDKPLIVSDQKGDDTLLLRQWIHRKESELNIVATYNLLFNASLMVEEGIGYAICYDGIINTEGSRLCFRPFFPRLDVRSFIVWKKYQVFSKAAKIFLEHLRKHLENCGCGEHQTAYEKES